MTNVGTLSRPGGLLAGPYTTREALLSVADELERLIADADDRGEEDTADDLRPILATVGELAERF